MPDIKTISEAIAYCRSKPTSQEMRQIAELLDELHSVLIDMDTFMDFGKPIKDGEPVEFQDASAINVVLARAYSFLRDRS